MKAEIKIPKGFRRLRHGEHPIANSGDYWFDKSDMTWNEYGPYDRVEDSDNPIRRIRKAK